MIRDVNQVEPKTHLPGDMTVMSPGSFQCRHFICMVEKYFFSAHGKMGWLYIGAT